MQSNSYYEPGASEKKPARKDSYFTRARRFLFGNDIFVSYARRDSDYALALATELTKHRVDPFVDQFGTPAGKELPPELVRMLHKSTMLVIVGTRRAAESENVMKEVLEFKKTKRPIIPITFVDEEDFIKIRNDETPQNLKGTLEGAAWYEAIDGMAKTLESQAKLRVRDSNGTIAPSPQVVSRIINAKGFLSRRKGLRRAFWTTFASFLAVLAMVGVSVLLLIDKSREQVREALAEQVAAEQKRLSAERARDLADRAREDAERKTRNAQDDLRATKEQLKKAAADLLTANKITKEEQAKAGQARSEADRQRKNALARRTATRADALRAQAVQRERDWAEMLQESVLLSIESAKRLSAIGMSSADSTQSLRSSLSLLPRAVRTAGYGQELEDALLTPDGKHVITKDENNVLRVRDAATDRQVSKEIRLKDDRGNIAFNPDRTLVATPLARKLAVWDLPQGTLRWETERQDSDEFVLFSPDGKLLAASTATPASDESKERVKSIVIWDSMTGKKITEVRYGDNLNGVALRPVHNQIVLSLNKTLQQSDNSTKVEHIVQIWDLKEPATLIVTANANEALYDLTFSPDGRLLGASSKGSATIWELGGVKEFTPIKGIEIDPDDAEYIQKIDFSPDGKTIGTWGQDGTMQTWDVLTGRKLWDSGTRDAEDWDYFKPYVVLRDGDGIRAVDVRTGKDVARVIHREGMLGIDYAAESDRLIVYHKNQVKIYDTGSAQEEVRLRHRGVGRLAAFSSNLKFVAIVSGNEIAVWDLTTAREITRLSAGGKVVDPVMSPDGSRLAAWCDDKALYIWKVGGQPQVWRIPDIKNTDIRKLTFSSYGRFLAIETSESDTKVLDLVQQREIAKAEFASFSPDESLVVLVRDYNLGQEAATLVVDLRTGSEVAVLPRSGTDEYLPPVFSPDGKHMAMEEDGDLKVFEILDPQKGFDLTLPANFLGFAYSPNGKYILGGGGGDGDEVFQVWEAATGKPVTPVLKIEKQFGWFVSPDSEHFVTYTFPSRGIDGEMRVWEIEGGRSVACVVYKRNLNIVNVSPDNRYLFISADDEPARVLDIRSERTVAELAHDGPVKNSSFSPDGSFIATVGGDGTARVWEVGEWREVSRITQEGGVVLANFSADGRRLATIGNDLTARVWILSEQELIERACRTLDHNLSPEEWQNNFADEVYGATCDGLPQRSKTIERHDGDCKPDRATSSKDVVGVSRLRRQHPKAAIRSIQVR